MPSTQTHQATFLPLLATLYPAPVAKERANNLVHGLALIGEWDTSDLTGLWVSLMKSVLRHEAQLLPGTTDEDVERVTLGILRAALEGAFSEQLTVWAVMRLADVPERLIGGASMKAAA